MSGKSEAGNIRGGVNLELLQDFSCAFVQLLDDRQAFIKGGGGNPVFQVGVENNPAADWFGQDQQVTG